MGHIERQRVAQVVVDLGSGRTRRRASGYRVTASSILTAGHVVSGARAVMVILNADLPDERRIGARVSFEEGVPFDVAVLEIEPEPAERVPPLSFGRVAQEADVVRCTVVGFPRWKAREGRGSAAVGGWSGPYRDSHQAEGTIAGLSNWRQGTLEIQVEPPGADAESGHSAWEGMSGALVWSSGSAIGLISEHHIPEGNNRLTGVRVEGWYTLGSERLRLLRTLTGMPQQADHLITVRSSAADGYPSASGSTAAYAGAGSPLPLRAIRLIVEQMLIVPELANPTELHQFISLLPTGILGSLSYAPQPRAQLVNVVRRCRAAAGGRQALVDALELTVGEPAELSLILSVLDSQWPA